MQKIYDRINWENYPSTKTAVNDDNLNKMDYALDAIDDRVVSLYGYEERAKASELAAKASEENAEASDQSAATHDSNAKAHKESAEALAAQAESSKQDALTYSQNAKESETNSKSSEQSAKAYADNAKGSADTAKSHMDDAAEYASNASISATSADDKAKAAALSSSNAKISETNAKASEELAAEHLSDTETLKTKSGEYASDALTSEQKALLYSQNAKSSEDNAKSSEENANASKESAKTYSDTSKSYADAAQTSKNDAKTSASTAATKATEASNYADAAEASAEIAHEKAEEMTDFADQSKSYAVGTNNTYRNGDATDNAKYYYEQAKSISEGLNGSLLPMGTITFSQLSSQPKVSGYMYNISNEFTTDSTFKEGSGIAYPAGTNVYYTADGYWDCLAGTSVTGVKGSSESTYRKGNVNITKANIGLGNVENKSSATIRGEITKSDVVSALGYEPPTEGKTYDPATATQDGLMSSEDKVKLNGIASNANNYTHPNSGATAGTYRSVTVDAKGHVTGGTNPTTTIAQGGTGATTNKEAAFNLVGDIPETTTSIQDSYNIVFRYEAPSKTEGVFLFRKASLLWNYIKGKADSIYAAITHKHTVADISDLTATATELNYMDGVTSNVQTQINDLGKSVADGKELLATTISGYGYQEVASDATFAIIDNKLKKSMSSHGTQSYLQGINEARVGDAVAENVLAGKTFTNASGSGLTGTMANYSGWTGNTTGSGNVKIPAGYHDGTGYISGSGAYTAARDTFYCPNGGASGNWTGVVSGLSGTHVPGKQGDYYRGIAYIVNSKKVYYSNNGTTWSQLGVDLPATGYFVKCAGSTVVVSTTDGMYYTEDSGATWVKSYSLKNMALDRFNNVLFIYAGLMSTEYGLYYSYDGKDWAIISDFLSECIIHLNHIASPHAGKMIATTYSKLFCSYYSGINYEFTTYKNVSGLTVSNVQCSACDPEHGYVLLGGKGSIYKVGNIYTGANSANPWKTISITSTHYIYDLLKIGPKWFAASNGGIYTSVDDGETWSLTYSSNGVMKLRYIHGRLYAFGNNTNYLVYSSQVGAAAPATFTRGSMGGPVEMFEIGKYTVLVTKSTIAYSKSLY